MNGTLNSPGLEQAGVSIHTVEQVLQHAARCSEVFFAAKQSLKIEYFFEANELAHRYIWAGILAYYDQFGELPKAGPLSEIVLSLMTFAPEVQEPAIESANAVIEWMFDPRQCPDSYLTPHQALVSLKKLVLEKTAGQRVRDAVMRAAGGPLTSVPRLIEQLQKDLDSAANIDSKQDSDETMPADPSTSSKPPIPTGVPFIDQIMGGGSQAGDVNVIIGPTGGGKTTLAMQICVSIGEMQQTFEAEPDKEPGLVVFFSYEDNKEMMRVRAASCAAQINKDRLRFLKNYDELSTTGNLQDYEKQMYRYQKKTDDLLGEKERYAAIRPWMNKYVRLVDFHDPSLGGSGGVDEVRQHLHSLQDKAGLPIKTVFLDWAGQMVRNNLQMTKGSVEGSAMALALGGLVGEINRHIVSNFNCTVWVPHQLKGQACKRPPAALPHHSEAEWCASFAHNAWFAFVLGTKDSTHSVCQLSATKTRHSTTGTPFICKIDGAFCRLVNVSQHFTIDKVSRMLMPQREAANIQIDRGVPVSVHMQDMISKGVLDAAE